MKTPFPEISSQLNIRDPGAQVYHDTILFLDGLLKNPMLELFVAVLLLNKLHEAGIISGLEEGVAKLGVTEIITAQQLAPLIPYVPEIVKAIGAAMPAGSSITGLVGAGVGAAA